uniref:Uncharacterized protein n=1 Tax=Timema tahoe TaxID=61484 RepID=A0A7R9IKZ0_9NEOP|nr:unnamed protein product [Timema tahoe]
MHLWILLTLIFFAISAVTLEELGLNDQVETLDCGTINCQTCTTRSPCCRSYCGRTSTGCSRQACNCQNVNCPSTNCNNQNCVQSNSCVLNCQQQNNCDTNCQQGADCNSECPQLSGCVSNCQQETVSNNNCPDLSSCVTNCQKQTNCNTNCQQGSVCNNNCPELTSCVNNCQQNTNCQAGCNGEACNQRLITNNCNGVDCFETSPIQSSCCQRECCSTTPDTNDQIPIIPDGKERFEQNIVIHNYNNNSNGQQPYIQPPVVFPNFTFPETKVHVNSPAVSVLNNPNITVIQNCGHTTIVNKGSPTTQLKNNCDDKFIDLTESSGEVDGSEEKVETERIEVRRCCRVRGRNHCVPVNYQPYVRCYQPGWRNICDESCSQQTPAAWPPVMPEYDGEYAVPPGSSQMYSSSLRSQQDAQGALSMAPIGAPQMYSPSLRSQNNVRGGLSMAPIGAPQIYSSSLRSQQYVRGGSAVVPLMPSEMFGGSMRIQQGPIYSEPDLPQCTPSWPYDRCTQPCRGPCVVAQMRYQRFGGCAQSQHWPFLQCY